MALMFDMPLERLLTYPGRNPKPADFDAFWDRGLAEMDAMDSQVEMTSAAFQAPFADCFDLRFTGVGGARVYAKLLKPKRMSGKCPAILQFHGYSGDAGEWREKLSFVAAGFVVAALDCRGQGGLSEDVGGTTGNTLHGHIIRGLDDAPEKLLFRQIFLDCAQLAKIVMALPEVDADRVGCMGGSQGGGLTLACASLVPRIKKAAPCYPFLSDYQRIWEMEQDKAAYAELREYFRHTDPTHERKAETFMKLGYIDIQHLCPRLRAEVFLGVGFADTVCPPSTQFAAYNKISSPKSFVSYPDFGHEGLPGHGDRVYQFMLGLL